MDGLGDPDHCGIHVADHRELDGFRGATDNDFSGWDRQPWRVTNEDEIVAEYGRQHDRPEIECAYCGNRHRSRSVEGALRWFQAHDCDMLFRQEQAGIVFDLNTEWLEAA